MAITFVGAEKVNSAGGGDVLNPVVDRPAGIAEGDLVLLVATADTDAGSLTLPAEFTVEFNGLVPNNAVGSTHLAVGWKLATASEPTGYTVTLGALDGYSLSCSAWSGVDSDQPAVAFTAATEANSIQMPAVPSVTVPAAGDMLINIVSTARGTSFSEQDNEDYYQPPAEITEIVDSNDGSGTGYSGHAIGYEEATDAGASATRQWTHFDDDDGGLAGVLVLARDTGAAALLEGAVEFTLEAGGVLGDPEPINHVGSTTGTSDTTGTISLAYPAGTAPGHVAIAAITSDDGTKDVSLPAGFTSLAQPYGELMEETIRKAAGKVAGDINPTYADKVYANARVGATYLAMPVFQGVQILWQDAERTIPAEVDGDPILALDDVSGYGHHAIQSVGVASFTLRYDGTNYWIDVAASDDRPIMPVAALTPEVSTLVIGYDQTVATRSVLLSNQDTSNGFLHVSQDDSTSTIINSEVTFDAIRTDTSGDMADYSPLPTDRDDNYEVYFTSEVITWQRIEFTTTWTSNPTGVYMLGYSPGGWATAGRFYGMAIVSGDGFQNGVPRGDGTLAFTPDVGYRIIDGTEPATADFTHDAAEQATAAISVFKMVDVEAGPFDAEITILSEIGEGEAISGDDRHVPAIETVTDGAVVVHVITNGQATAGHVPPSDVLEIVDVSDGTGEDGTSLAIGWEDYPQAGSHPQRTWQIDTETLTPYRSYAIALKPLYETPSQFESNVLAQFLSSATLGSIKHFAGSAEVALTTQGELEITAPLEGNADIAMTAQGSLARVIPLDGNATGALTVEASLGAVVGLIPAALGITLGSAGVQAVGTALTGDATAAVEASATDIPLKRGLEGSATLAFEAVGELARGSLGKGSALVTMDADAALLVRRGLEAQASVTATQTSAYQVKRAFSSSRVTVAATTTANLLRHAMFGASPSLVFASSARLKSFKEVQLDGDTVIEFIASASTVDLMSVFSEDVVAIGLVTIIRDFGGSADRRTIMLNPSDRVLNVSARSGN